MTLFEFLLRVLTLFTQPSPMFQSAIALAVLSVALYVIVSRGAYDDSTTKWAYATIGWLLGHRLRY
jgi:hypothetical protein